MQAKCSNVIYKYLSCYRTKRYLKNSKHVDLKYIVEFLNLNNLIYKLTEVKIMDPSIDPAYSKYKFLEIYGNFIVFSFEDEEDSMIRT